MVDAGDLKSPEGNTSCEFESHPGHRYNAWHMPLFIVIAIILALIVLWLCVILAMILIIYGSIMIRVPFVPVAQYVVDALKKEELLKTGDVFYDLGSGDGRAVLAMAQAFPGAKAIGIEKGPFPYLVSRFWLSLRGVKNASFLFQDFSKVDLSHATHVYMYLYPDVVQKLLPKLKSELKPGSQVVTCDFPFKERPAKRTLPVIRGRKKYTLYFYEF